MENMNARDFMNAIRMEDLNDSLVYAGKEDPELMYVTTTINQANQKTQETLKKLETLKWTFNSKYGVCSMFAIKNVIFNEPATIVFWEDGTKTVVKAENEAFDPEKGLTMAIAKKVYGNKGSYFNQIRKWVNTYYEEE